MKRKKLNIKKLIVLLAAFLIILLIIVLLVRGCGSNDSGSGSEGEQTAAQKAETLIKDYYDARLSLNEGELARIYNVDNVMEIDIYKKMNEYLSSIENIRVYLRDGISRGEYIAFAQSDMVSDRYGVTVPNVSPVYIRTDDAGEFYIYPGDYSPSLMRYIYPLDIDRRIDDIAQNDEEIRLLLENNAEAIKALAAENEAFAGLYRTLTDSEGATDIDADASPSQEEESDNQSESAASDGN